MNDLWEALKTEPMCIAAYEIIKYIHDGKLMRAASEFKHEQSKIPTSLNDAIKQHLKQEGVL